MPRPPATAYVNERKFAGTRLHLEPVAALLGARCLPDGEFPEGVVNSIYFDTPRLRSYREKDDGDFLKTKVRLRWYGRDEELGESVPAFLELKYRIGSARDKVRLELAVPRSLLLDTPYGSGAFADFLAAHSAALGEPLAIGWTPAVQITYDRLRYIDEPSGSRVSVDWNIRAPRFDPVRFPWAVPVELDDLVCEFKNPGGTPPPWAETMLRLGLRLGSFSKYGECMRRLAAGEP